MAKLVCVLFVIAARSAAAQPAADEGRSPTTATWIAIVGTAVPLAIVGTGAAIDLKTQNDTMQTPAGNIMMAIGGTLFLYTPTLGHAYGAHQYLTLGTGIRVGCAIAGVIATVVVGDAVPFAVIGGTCMLGGAVYDIATAGRATRRHNERRGPAATIAPMAIRTAEHATVPGVAVIGTF